MSEAPSHAKLDPDLVERLEWPGVDLSRCRILGSGIIYGYDTKEHELLYQKQIKIKGVLQWVNFTIDVTDKTCIPPFDDPECPISSGEEFWHVIDLETRNQAILREPAIMSKPYLQ